MHRYTQLAAAVLAALSTYSYADDTPPAQGAAGKDAATLPTVNVTAEQDASQSDYQPAISNVGAKTPQALRDIPQTINVVDKELMQAQGASSLADALRNVPGI